MKKSSLLLAVVGVLILSGCGSSDDKVTEQTKALLELERQLNVTLDLQHQNTNLENQLKDLQVSYDVMERIMKESSAISWDEAGERGKGTIKMTQTIKPFALKVTYIDEYLPPGHSSDAIPFYAEIASFRDKDALPVSAKFLGDNYIVMRAREADSKSLYFQEQLINISKLKELGEVAYASQSKIKAKSFYMTDDGRFVLSYSDKGLVLELVDGEKYNSIIPPLV